MEQWMNMNSTSHNSIFKHPLLAEIDQSNTHKVVGYIRRASNKYSISDCEMELFDVEDRVDNIWR